MATLLANDARTHWETQGSWAGLVARQLREADNMVVPLDLSRVLLRAAAEYITEPGWKRGHLALEPGAPTSTLGAIHFAALPFRWSVPEHFHRWRAAALVVHRYLNFKGGQYKNPIATIDGWDMAPGRDSEDVYEVLEGAAGGLQRCRRAACFEASVGHGECWAAVEVKGRALCKDHRGEQASKWFMHQPGAKVPHQAAG